MTFVTQHSVTDSESASLNIAVAVFDAQRQFLSHVGKERADAVVLRFRGMALRDGGGSACGQKPGTNKSSRAAEDLKRSVYAGDEARVIRHRLEILDYRFRSCTLNWTLSSAIRERPLTLPLFPARRSNYRSAC